MWGQWVGNFEGDICGFVTLNIDKDSPFSGRLLFSSQNQNNASFYADAIVSTNKNELLICLENISLYSGHTGEQKSSEPQKSLPNKLSLVGEFNNERQLSGKFDSHTEINGIFQLGKLDGEASPDITVQPIEWDKFKTKVLEMKKNNAGLIFRGQEDSRYTLQTTFHRQNRRDLIRYGADDILMLRHHLTACLGRHFDLGDSLDYSELLYIAQHHGFPTPLLDWTESPFVAAFFAFHRIEKESSNGHIRMFLFDKDLWLKEVTRQSGQPITIDEPAPCFSPFNVISTNNARALPQQSLVTFTNVYAIEAFIRHKEGVNNSKYLSVYDIPYSDRQSAMKDLEIMGITASSLFPGLDGVCQALKEKLFV